MEKGQDDIDFHKHKIYHRDPFAVDAPPKAHYFPSPERRIKARQKYIVGKAPLEKAKEEQPAGRLGPMDELFLKGSNMYQSAAQTDNITDDVNFDESWPTSEKPSSLSLSGLEDDGPIDIQRYQATLDKFVAFKNTLSTDVKQNKPAASERLRKPGTSTQSAGIGKGNRKSDSKGASKIPVKNKATGKPKVKEKDEGNTENVSGSTLQRYIERFRNSAPMSREEREKRGAGGAEDFWWMTNQERELVPSDCSTPREPERLESKTRGTTPLTQENLDKYSAFKGEKPTRFKDWSDSPDHKRTLELQERAEKLLERSSSTIISTDPAVSTDGLGSNISDMSSLDDYPYKPTFARYTVPVHSDMSSLDDYPYKPSFARYTDKLALNKTTGDIVGHISAVRTIVHPSRPEDDPLHQWRLRRRMEQAKEATPVNVGSFGFLTKTEQQAHQNKVFFGTEINTVHPTRPEDDLLHQWRLRRHMEQAKEAAPVNVGSFGFLTKTEQQGHQNQVLFGTEINMVHPTRPEDDPLHQWRLRRRMEQAKDAAPVNVGSFGFLTKTEQQKKIDSKLGEFKQRLAGKEVQAPPSKVQALPSLSDTDQSAQSNPALTARLQFTPAPQLNHADVQKDAPIQTSEIASPTLHRRQPRSEDAQPVDPHLHLMCDLLLCPHQGEYRDKLITDSSDKQSELQKNYKQYLEAEKPDVENTDNVQDNTNDNDNNDTEFTDRRKIESTNKQKERRKQEKVHFVNGDDNISENDLKNYKEKNVKSDKLESVQSVDVNGDNYDDGKDIDDRRNGIDRRDEVVKGRNDERTNVIKPTSSSSPKLGRKTVDSAIGQAIKDHLFSTTTSTVLSSMDSLPPSRSVDQNQPRIRPIQQEDEAYMSDGEYSEDELLQMLRNQRALFERQLQQIDEKLKSIQS